MIAWRLGEKIQLEKAIPARRQDERLRPGRAEAIVGVGIFDGLRARRGPAAAGKFSSFNQLRGPIPPIVRP